METIDCALWDDRRDDEGWWLIWFDWWEKNNRKENQSKQEIKTLIFRFLIEREKNIWIEAKSYTICYRKSDTLQKNFHILMELNFSSWGKKL